METIALTFDSMKYILFFVAVAMVIKQHTKNMKWPNNVIEQAEAELRDVINADQEEVRKEAKKLDDDLIKILAQEHKNTMKHFKEHDMNSNYEDLFIYFALVITITLMSYSLYAGDYVEAALMLGFFGVNFYAGIDYMESRWNLKILIILSKISFEKRFPSYLQKDQELQEIHDNLETVEKEVLGSLNLEK